MSNTDANHRPIQGNPECGMSWNPQDSGGLCEEKWASSVISPLTDYIYIYIYMLDESSINILSSNCDNEVFWAVSGTQNSQNFPDLKLEDCRNRVLPGTKLT